jgi:hypothetical protein
MPSREVKIQHDSSLALHDTNVSRRESSVAGKTLDSTRPASSLVGQFTSLLSIHGSGHVAVAGVGRINWRVINGIL